MRYEGDDNGHLVEYTCYAGITRISLRDRGRHYSPASQPDLRPAPLIFCCAEADFYYTIPSNFVNTAWNQSGRGHSKVRRCPVRGWMKDSRRACRHCPARPGQGRPP